MNVRTPLQIGITGGIGSGKSLVSKIFQCLGVPIYDSDSRAKNLMTTDGILISLIKKEFGALSYHKDGTLNRSYISQQVFQDKDKLNMLNSLIHPRVQEDYKDWVVKNQHYSYVLKEAALLFETKSFLELDKTIVVSAPVTIRIKRVLQRDPHRSETEIKRIISNQMPEEEKIKSSDFVIVNDETKLVIPQVLELHKGFVSDQK